MTQPFDIHENSDAGLNTNEARLRLIKVGPNEPVSSRRTSSLVQILLLFINPLAIILLVASAISAALGEILNASVIALMVLLSATLNFPRPIVPNARSSAFVKRLHRQQPFCETAIGRKFPDASWY
jgi:Mg2+-importing ATPase